MLYSKECAQKYRSHVRVDYFTGIATFPNIFQTNRPSRRSFLGAEIISPMRQTISRGAETVLPIKEMVSSGAKTVSRGAEMISGGAKTTFGGREMIF
ncbi:MAG: hypothetical protein IPK69_09445 [Phycisphaerales bacterium]|nr:MAG: hypothetical protein IPK69_09445 [Phycisphaerales bacterium]